MAAVAAISTLLICCMCGCNKTKKDYEENGAPHVMSVVDETYDYTVYRHDETGVWYLSVEGSYGGRAICIMVNPDGSPYTGE